MTRLASIPPISDARQARASFTRASEILSEKSKSSPPRRFVSSAADVRGLADELASLLERGSSLQSIDAAAVALGRKCLAVQQETLVARSRRT